MIKLENLNKNYNSIPIYKDTNYTFKDCALTCFLGPSGSGKTTLLNLIAGFDTNYSGTIKNNVVCLNTLSTNELCNYRLENIGFVFQNYNILKRYTALENVLVASNLDNSLNKSEKINKATELLIKLGLENQINQNVETLSGGQKQRVAIARALINDPKIILADEPTGALDKESSLTIMDILKSISKTKTVIVITHDKEIADYADEIISLENNTIKVFKSYDTTKNHDKNEIALTKTPNKKSKLSFSNSLKISLKNLKIHFIKFFISALIIALGSSAFIGALSSTNILEQSINDFKEKNFFFNKGMIPKYNNGIISNKNLEDINNKLYTMDTIENIYYQYELQNLNIKFEGKNISIESKIPTPTSNISIVYGNMPRTSENEIVLSPSLATKFSNDLKSLINKNVTLSYIDKNKKVQEISLKISGIANINYDDMIFSPKVEKEIYKDSNLGEPEGITFDIKDFNEIIDVQNQLTKQSINVFTKYLEVENFQKTFSTLLKLYSIVSYIVLAISLFISSIILYKNSLERYNEIGLLSSLGYNRKNIKQILVKETSLFTILSSILSIVTINILNLLYKINFGYTLGLNINSFFILLLTNILLTLGISFIINNKLIRTEPAKALSK